MEARRQRQSADNAGSSEKSAFAVSAPAVTLPKGGGAIRGMGEKFAANPVTGTGSMSVPMATSPGRSGFGPQLSLSYDSGSGNGPFGFGWSLSLPSITRKTDKGLPRYQDSDESDVFILSGAEDLVPVLVEVGGNWVRETVPPRTVDGKIYRIQRYRPRIEGLFARIERWTNQADLTDTFWRSISKDDITTWYGKSAESRIADPADPIRVFSWLICESYDDKGNVIVYGYKEENSDNDNIEPSRVHEHNRTDKTRSANRYLKRIRYGNHAPYFPKLLADQPWPVPPGANAGDGSSNWFFEVIFDYGEHHVDNPKPDDAGTWLRRHDPFSSYRAGFEIRAYRLCQRVLMFHHFSGEQGVGQDCLVRSTDFVYRNTRNNPDDLRKGHPIASFIASVTHNGYKRKPAGGYLKRSLPPVEFEYSQATINEDVQEFDADSLANLPEGLDGGRYQWVDLDGEGVSGVLTEQADAWYYKSNLGDGRFGALEVVARKPSLAALQSGRQQFLDLAGDGQLDLVEMEGPAPGFFERTQDEDWESFVTFRSLPNVAWRDPNLRFVDLTGDGHADVLITEHEVFTWYPSLAEVGFGPAEKVRQALDEEKGPRLVFADGTQSIYLADLSGDGLTDLVRIRNGEVCYWPNLGYVRFGAKVTMDNAPQFDAPDQFDQKRIRLADIDGSGVTDILYLARDGVRLYLNESGNRWSDVRTLSRFPRIDNLSSVQAVDLLGNGTACLVWSSPLPGDVRRPMRYIDLMGGQKPHLLTKVINNLGAETRVQYAASTKFYLADKLAGNPWITRLPFPVHVVERVETYDRVSRNRFVTRYAYHHGYFDGVEREFRGFGMVEQRDTEEFSTLSASTDFPSAANIDASSHVPPVWTKTWFHTGAYIDREHISDFFAGIGEGEGEYYREPGLTDSQAKALLLDDTELPDKILKSDGTRVFHTLSAEEEREACRALKGSILRQEVYALDNSDKSAHPYTVSERNYTIELLQPEAGNRNAVFYTHPRETIDYHYERDPADPRSAHQITLEADAFGNVLKSVAIGYGRRRIDPTLSAQDQAQQTQILITYTENSVTINVANDDDYRAPLGCEARAYELTGFALPAAKARYAADDFVTPAAHGVQLRFDHEVNYEDTPAAGRARRLIEHVRTLFRTNDLSGLLPLGQLQSMALPGEAYKLAFTPGLLTQVYQRPRNGQPPENLLPDPANVLPADITAGQTADRGGYLSSQILRSQNLFPANAGNPLWTISDADDHWWIPSGRIFYREQGPPADELAEAQAHFFLPRRFEDPFGNKTFVRYASDLLVLETEDAVGNKVSAGARDATTGAVTPSIDYRVLQPSLIMDPNRNRSKAAFDALGMVAGSAVMGKPEDNPPEGDLLEDSFKADLTPAEIDPFFADPKGQAVGLLGKATTRIVYDLDRFRRTRNANPQDPDKWEPVFAATSARETHVSAPLPSGGLKIQVSFSYSDGFGREIQKKIQAEPGPVPKRDVNGRIIVDGNNQPVMTDHDVEPRWVGSGWTVFNNKGKPVRQYEPFFSDTHKFDFEPKIGVSPILSYDPVERVIATLHPNHTWEKVVFDSWRQATFDVNDTVTLTPSADDDVKGFFLNPDGTPRIPSSEYLPTWHGLRTDPLHAVEFAARYPDATDRSNETTAATKATAHANTPTRAHFDTLGRTFLTIADNGASGKYPTRVVLDIEGKPLAIVDAHGNTVMEYRRRIPQADGSIRLVTGYDVAGNQLYQNSMDAGERWVLNDVSAKPIRRWDGRNHEFIHRYDALRRPIEIRVKGGDRPRLLDNLCEKIIYGEGKTLNGKADTALNVRAKPFEHYDTAGKVRFEEYDFKGNLSKSSRRLAKDYKGVVNWGVADPDAPLETESFFSETEYDALNRVVAQTAPDGSITRATYNPASLLEAVEVEQPGATTSFVSDIDYNEKGQRLAIAYGSSVTTTYAYDRETFRPIHLQSKKGATLLQDLYYTYDPAGNISQIEDRAQPTRFFNNMKIEPVKEYAYDPLYRLTNAKGGEHIAQVNFGTEDNWNDSVFGKQYNPNDPMEWRNYEEQYTYDPVGNIDKVEHVANGGGWTRTYAYEAKNNRLVSTTIGAQTYDYSHHPQHGFITFMPHLQTMEWNFRDELQAVAKELRVGGATPELTYYVYDSNGQRVRKITENAAPPNATPTKKAERIYLGTFEIYRQHSGTHAGLERKTLHVMDDKQRIAMIETRSGVDDGTDQRLIRYQLGNHLGSVSLETDGNGRVISYEEYHPYGTTAYQAVDKTIKAAAKRYRYTGKERDEESGFYYHGARYYAPWLGRWVSTDPAGLVDSTCLYIYAQNRPLVLVDATGWQAGGPWEPLIQMQRLQESVDEVLAPPKAVFNQALQGDFYEGETTWGGVGTNVAVGFTPVAGQAADIRDTAAAIKHLWDEPSLGNLGLLGMALVAWWPGFGDAIKGGSKVARKAGTEALETGLEKGGKQTLESTTDIAGKEAKVKGEFQTAERLKRGNLGEKLAADALAAKGHSILSFKPSILGTNQGGIDIVTVKDGVLHLIDNKALTRGGNVSSVSALTTNFAQNLKAVRQELIGLLSKQGISAEEAKVLQQAIDALDKGKIVKAVTNANLTPDNRILSGVTQELQNKGIQFIDVFK